MKSITYAVEMKPDADAGRDVIVVSEVVSNTHHRKTKTTEFPVLEIDVTGKPNWKETLAALEAEFSDSHNDTYPPPHKWRDGQ